MGRGVQRAMADLALSPRLLAPLGPGQARGRGDPHLQRSPGSLEARSIPSTSGPIFGSSFCLQAPSAPSGGPLPLRMDP